MTTPRENLNPFQSALGPDLATAAEKVREHFDRPAGTYRYRGVMARVWRRHGLRGGLALPLLWLARFANTLFPDEGPDVPFEMEHTVAPLPGGRTSMTFRRTFRFRAAARRFDAHLTFDPVRHVILDRLGRGGRLEVELLPRVDRETRSLCLSSGRQWLRVAGRLRVRIPNWIVGTANVREWQEPDGRLGICVVIHNPMLGNFFGYEGTFRATGEGTCASGQPNSDRSGKQSRWSFATTKGVER